MKYQILFSLKNNENIFKTVVCCSHDWHLKDVKWCPVCTSEQNSPSHNGTQALWKEFGPREKESALTRKFFALRVDLQMEGGEQ